MPKVEVGTIFPKEGEFCWAPNEENPERIVLGLSIGVVRMKVVRGKDPGDVPDGPKWGWNGDLEKPTLTPSINSDGEKGNWHGYLEDGRLKGSHADPM